MSVSQWSQTASSNQTADPEINLREGQGPSTLNDAVRALMAEVAKWRDDLSGNLVTGGSSTAYTLTTNQGLSSLTDGLAVAARMDETNGAAPTLNVDSLGAKAIATIYGTAVGAGKLRAGGVYVFVYDSTDDKWIVHGNPNEGFEAGTKMLFRQTTPPTGWTKDTTYTDAALRVTNGTISQKTISGEEFSTLLASRSISIQKVNIPNYTLPDTLALSGSQSGGLARNLGVGSSGAPFSSPASVKQVNWSDTTLSLTGSVTSGGSGTPITLNMDVNFVDVIIATKD